MTKRTRRILPKGQRRMYGGTKGLYEHGRECQCRKCRRLREQGRPLVPPEYALPGTTRLLSIDRDKCPICKAGVIIPDLNMCASCVDDYGILPG